MHKQIDTRTNFQSHVITYTHTNIRPTTRTYVLKHTNTHRNTQGVLPERDSAASSIRSRSRPGVATTTYTHTVEHTQWKTHTHTETHIFMLE